MTGKAIISQNSGREIGGVTALFCACCGQPVGIVNVAEARQMLETGEVYICRRCMRRPEEVVVAALEDEVTDSLWYQAMEGGLAKVDVEAANGK